MEKTIKQLELNGKTLIFGGVYSNLQALEELKQIAERHNIPPENCICTGDLLGYCAQPEETAQLFKLWGARSIAGNVEIQLKEGAADCGCDFKEGSRCDAFSQRWYPYVQSKLSQDSLNFIKGFPDHFQFNFADKKVTVVHGSWFNISEFIFKSTAWSVKQSNFDETQSDVIIAGHCGLPFLDFADNKTWINPGVIGMPANEGSPKVWYAILDDSNNEFSLEHHKMTYNHKFASKLMQNGSLPEEYAETLLTGIWDNTDILPLKEKEQKGLEIKL